MSCPRFGRIPFVAGCFRTSSDVAVLSKTSVIPRKLLFDVAMQNAQNVFESLQGHLFSFPTLIRPFNQPPLQSERRNRQGRADPITPPRRRDQSPEQETAPLRS